MEFRKKKTWKSLGGNTSTGVGSLRARSWGLLAGGVCGAGWVAVARALTRVGSPAVLAVQGGLVLGGAVLGALLGAQVDRLRRDAILDHLTGVHNRHYLFRALHRELERASRYGRPFSLLFVDVDDLKCYNDTWGHAAGDRLLRGVGELLREQVRATDVVCRYGGDEFVILLPETSRRGAERLGQRLVAAARATVSRGLSVGVATFPEDGEGADAEALLAAADRALARASGTRGGWSWPVPSSGVDRAGGSRYSDR